MPKKTDNSRILSRIEKCLKLASSSNPAESATALRHAQSLMEKYGVDRDDVELSRIGQASAVRGTTSHPSDWVVSLCRLIAKAFSVRYLDLVRKQPMDMSGKRHSYRAEVVFIGLDEAPAVAIYAFQILFRQLSNDRKEFVKDFGDHTPKGEKTKLGDIYALSWLAAIESQVEALAKRPKEDEMIKRWIDKEYTGTSVMKGPRIQDIDVNDLETRRALSAGYATGKKVSLHRPLNGSAPQDRLGAN